MSPRRALLFLGLAAAAFSRELNVALDGSDGGDGSPARPFRTVQHAAEVAQSGDVVTVHAGVYRERVHPATGNVTFQAAPGENVTISGAEPVVGWARVVNTTDTWKVVLPSYATFSNFNPYADLIRGDWISPGPRVHHTGAVYLADAWLDEAASLADVLLPVTRRSPPPQWFATVDGDDGTGTQYLANLLWVRPRGAAATISAGSPSWRYGTKPFNGSAGPCAAFILTGDVLRFDSVDFGAGATALDFSAAAGPGAGAALEVRVGDRWGALLGSGNVPSTGDWEAWQNFSVPITPTAGLQNISLVFLAPGYAAGSTTIYAQFGAQADPNAGSVEINARQTVLYPAEPYVNFVTVRGFTLERAATQWAPPSSEQVGIVGPHWSRGWVIEENEVRYATCSCISLGKYGDGTDNTNDKGQADPYTACVYRALENGWHKDRVGSHVVRNNHVHHCGQTGVVGSLGGAFSVITGNSIHDCFENRTFNGAEMAGIKLHGAVDVVIADNHIYNSGNFGIWLDWMAQGTMVLANLFHDNKNGDLFTEVDHGPTTIANNIMLSGLKANSAGGAYVHNMVAAKVADIGPDSRLTPSLVAHETDIAAVVRADNGDHRFYNNLIVGPAGFAIFNRSVRPCFGSGSVYTGASTGPSRFETGVVVAPAFNAGVALTEGAGGVWTLEVELDAAWASQPRVLVTTALLGNASIPNQAYTRADNSSFAIDADYFGAPRDASSPKPGPLEASGAVKVQVWPKAATIN